MDLVGWTWLGSLTAEAQRTGRNAEFFELLGRSEGDVEV